MTVGELKQILELYKDDVEVAVWFEDAEVGYHVKETHDDEIRSHYMGLFIVTGLELAPL